ncbi:MAG: ECF transporter S component [Lachnospiraceae bacterium]|nr:ECF transporter S component [Lachnospiraceae bacterium]
MCISVSVFESFRSNLGFVLSFLAIVLILFGLAYLLEKVARKNNPDSEPLSPTRRIAMIGMFSAVAFILMLFEVPLPFAPSFYKLDLSELPILIGAFAFGPSAGVMMEFIKILLKLLFKGTSTAFVGELANFAVGCSLILPASVLYSFKKTKGQALLSMIVGTLVLTIFGTSFNAFYLLPAFAKLYGMPLEALIGMGEAIFPSISGSVFRFVVYCVAPLNLIKGTVNSVVTLLVYKKLSPILKSSHATAVKKGSSVNG